MNTQTSTTTNEPHPADCARQNGCAECYEAEYAKVRALDAIRYPWASPAKLQWLREQIPPYGLFSRKGTKAGPRGVILLRVLPPVPFAPHLPTMGVEALRVASNDDLDAARRLPAGHPAAAYLSTRTHNRVLIVWGEGMLAAHELPEAEGGIGFTVLVADPAWLAPGGVA